VSERECAPATVLPDRQTALARARALAPRIAARAARAEADRLVPPETISELLASGLLGIVTARKFGGSELGFATLIEVAAELSAACGSTGWVYGVLAGHSWLLNLFPPQAQAEFHENSRALAATVFRMSGSVSAVPGGYRLSQATARFCSGIEHASWVIASNAFGTPAATENARFFLIPKESIQVIDDWFTAGMRGTGSCSIRIEEVFVPEYRSVAATDVMSGNSPGAQYLGSTSFHTPYQDVAPFSIVGAPLGLARRAVAAFSAGLKSRYTGVPPEQIAEMSATIARIGHAAADIDAAFALVVADAREVDSMPDPRARSAIERARLARDWAYAAHQCRYAVDSVFEAAGGAGIFDTSELQRIWRDVNSAAQHFAFIWDTAMTNFGRATLGLPPSSGTIRSL
jgi:alkylation response protein AidB-like acyl-CoA dehydrogenase